MFKKLKTANGKTVRATLEITEKEIKDNTCEAKISVFASSINAAVEIEPMSKAPIVRK